MKSTVLGTWAALVLASASLAAQAAEVTLTGWAFGSGHDVNASGSGVTAGSYSGGAGGFQGRLAGAGHLDTGAFLTYCVELEEAFSFGSSAMTGYTLVGGDSYFQARRLASPNRPDGAGVAERLGQLLTWAQADPSHVDTSFESTALQLAIWNIVYDTDWSVGAPSSFNDSSSHHSLASAFLAGASTTSSRYDVWVLTRAGTQDFLLTTQRVPEPGTLALTAAALAGVALARRRRA